MAAHTLLNVSINKTIKDTSGKEDDILQLYVFQGVLYTALETISLWVSFKLWMDVRCY